MRARTISIEPIPVPPPFEAAFLRTGKFPAPKDERQLLGTFWTRFASAVSARLNWSLEVFLQVEYLDYGRDVYDQHAVDWSPEVGLGVWPNRPPPELWKAVDFFKMAVEFQRTGRMRPLMYRVMRITGQPTLRARAQSLMAGTGMVVCAWTPGGGEEFLRKTKEEFLPAIQSPNFRIFPFFVPLLDFKSLRDHKPGELDRWLCGDAIYLRESPGDNAVILLATTPLAPLLEEAGAKAQLREGKTSTWIVGEQDGQV
jgi:hypothetical protein